MPLLEKHTKDEVRNVTDERDTQNPVGLELFGATPQPTRCFVIG
jgi:hypothetical protein